MANGTSLADKHFDWSWRRSAIVVMCRCCDVANETGLKIVFLKRMEANVRFTMQHFAGPGNALIGTSPGLGGGFYFIVRVSFQLCALCKTMHKYKG